MRPNNSLIVNGVATNANFVSSTVFADCIVRASAQIVVSSGSCVGTFVWQGSNDQGFPSSVYQPTNWNTIGSTASIVCSTTPSAKVFLLPLTEMSYEYIRIAFTDASAGSANGVVNVRMKSMGL